MCAGGEAKSQAYQLPPNIHHTACSYVGLQCLQPSKQPLPFWLRPIEWQAGKVSPNLQGPTFLTSSSPALELH